MLKELAEQTPEYDVLVVSDGSSDRTAEISRQAGAHVAVLPLEGMNVFNVGTGTGVSINEILDAIRGILNRPLRIDDLGERPGDVPAYYASAAKLTAATGWRSEVGLAEGLRRTVEYYQGRTR